MAASPITPTAMPDVERNSLVLGHLTSKVGVEAVRVYFDSIVPPSNLSAFLSSNKSILHSLTLNKPKKRLRNDQFQLLFPKKGTV